MDAGLCFDEDASGFPAGDGGAKESKGVDELVVSWKVWAVAVGVEDGGGVGWDEVWVDGDGAPDHVEESPDGQEPEGGGGEVDLAMEEDEDGDEDEHGNGVHEELGVALVEGGDGAEGHVGEYEEGEAFGDIPSCLHGLSVLDYGGGEGSYSCV